MAQGKAAWLEPHEPEPPDLMTWLAGWGIDPTKPIKQMVDKDGWRWFMQDGEEV